MAVICPNCGVVDYEVFYLQDWRERLVTNDFGDREWYECRFCKGLVVVEDG